MKDPNLIIRIAEPCHEDWNNMQPDAKGKFCGSCNKAVFDFSNKTDTEIKDVLMHYKDQQVCGRLKKTQVDRPLNISIDMSVMPRNMSSTKAFAVALFLVFGTLLFSCTSPEGKKISGIDVVNKENYVMGDFIVPEITPGDTLVKTDSVKTLCGIGESVVMGAMMIQDLPETDTMPAAKEVLVPDVETHVVGMMAYEIPAVDTIFQDSAIVKNKMIEQYAVTELANDLLVYPNPSRGSFTLKYSVLKRAGVRADIYDERGALLKTVIDVNGQFEGNYEVAVDVNDLPNGLYIVSLINNGTRFTKRLVIEK